MMYGRGVFNYGHMMGYGLGFNGWSWLIGIGILLLIVSVTYLLVKRGNTVRSNESALDLLKTKYAKGEITEEEYISRKNILKGK